MSDHKFMKKSKTKQDCTYVYEFGRLNDYKKVVVTKFIHLMEKKRHVSSEL